MATKIFPSLLLLLTSVLATAKKCSPVFGSCDFYVEQLEANVPCGPDGYALSLGNHYCHQASESIVNFSPKGQLWINNTMFCLQSVLTPICDGFVEMGCDSIEDLALDSHLHCYTEGSPNICVLPPKDVALWVTIVYKELLDLRTIGSVLEAGASCGHLYLDFVVMEIVDPVLKEVVQLLLVPMQIFGIDM